MKTRIIKNKKAFEAGRSVFEIPTNPITIIKKNHAKNALKSDANNVKNCAVFPLTPVVNKIAPTRIKKIGIYCSKLSIVLLFKSFKIFAVDSLLCAFVCDTPLTDVPDGAEGEMEPVPVDVNNNAKYCDNDPRAAAKRTNTKISRPITTEARLAPVALDTLLTTDFAVISCSCPEFSTAGPDISCRRHRK